MNNETDDNNDWWLYWNDTSSNTGSMNERSSEMLAGGDSLQFNETLRGWFAASLEAGKPPEHLREVLAHKYWQPTAFPGSNVVLRAIQRTGWFVPEAERTKPVAKKKKRAVQPPHFREDEIACFACADSVSEDALSATTWLKQLAPTTRVILLSDGAHWFGFFGAQFKALREYQQKQEAERTATHEETRRLELIAGQGSVEEFLAMTVKVKTQLELDSGHAQYGSARARVFSVYTAGYRGYVPEPETLTLRAVLERIAERTDYDGLEFNPPGFGDPPIASFGPNFARRLLRGEDMRNATICPARGVREFKMGEWWTRFGSQADAMMKKHVSALVADVRTLLAAIPPGQDALPREAVQSVAGALYLRCEPRYGQRQWLEWFLRRCERALRARWRVGIF